MDLAALTDEALAEMLRPVRIQGDGTMYIKRADVAAVRLARARNAAGVRMQTDPTQPGRMTILPDPPLSVPASLNTSNLRESVQLGGMVAPVNSADAFLRGKGNSSPSQPLEQAGRYAAQKYLTPSIGPFEVQVSDATLEVVGAGEDRQWVSHALTFWWPRIASVSFTGQPYGNLVGGSCSGTMIGRYTAVSAAHCFYSPTGTYLGAMSWAVAVTRTLPPGGVLTETIGYPKTTGCYELNVPNGWITNHQDAFDYAVLDFKNGLGVGGTPACGIEPGSSTGWVAPAIGTASDHISAPAEMYAYDTLDQMPPQPVFPNATYVLPSMIQRARPAWHVWVNASDPVFVYHALDATRGSSGGGILQNIFQAGYGNSTLYWVGINAWQNPLEGRRNEWLLWTYITDATSEW